jgi:hypothetical protein
MYLSIFSGRPRNFFSLGNEHSLMSCLNPRCKVLECQIMVSHGSVQNSNNKINYKSPLLHGMNLLSLINFSLARVYNSFIVALHCQIMD